MIGSKFSHLTVLNFAGKSKNKSLLYECRCDCGNIVIKRGSHLRRHEVKSCGCYRKDETFINNLKLKLIKHGLSKSSTYASWVAMKSRCLNPNHVHYAKYGGRGIGVCQRWLIFENFLADMGIRPEGMTLDRIKVDGDYCPENCRWANPKQQSRNRNNNHFLTLNGQRCTLSEWSDITGIKKTTIRERLNRGWEVKRALCQSTKGGDADVQASMD
jgi:hypothetical protein